MLQFIFWILFGAIVGWVATILHGLSVHTKQGLAFVLAGIFGGLTGGLSGLALNPGIAAYDSQADGLTFAIFGAITFVLITRLASSNNNDHPRNT
ncbi:MAG TPA: hypothetical protein VD735_02615 [Candidatus Saccharimonadales bacterium]|nr:hypothetical protein [Candidatus Saccharimonadales bacterium]